MIILFWTLLSSYLYCSAQRYPLVNQPLFSVCDHCHQNLKLIDKIPILSYVLLKGRCRHCATKLTFDYFTIELVGFLIGIFFTFSPHPIKAHITLILLIYLFITDYLHHLIPDRIHVCFILLNFQYINLTTLLILMLISLFLLIFVRKEMFGMGDVKLMVSSTIHLSLYHVNLLIFLSSFLSLTLMLRNKKAQTTPFPFGCSWAISVLLLSHLI